MKSYRLAITMVLMLAASVWAVTEKQVDKLGSAYPLFISKGLYLGPDVPNPTKDTGNKITRSYGGSATVDVASTASGACSDTTFATMLGAKTGDACLVGLPATHPTNGQGSFSCVITAADTIKLRYCNPSAGALDPASAVYYYRTFSSQ